MTPIIIFLILFPIGLFFGLMFTMSMDGLKRFLVTLAISILIAGVITGLLISEVMANCKAWNNGKCPECATEWRLVNVERLRHGTELYYYTCDNCGKIITLYGNNRG